MFGSGEKYLVGYDISTEYTQISVFCEDDDIPTTVSMTSGSEDYNIPAVLFKREDVNQWYYGREAINFNEVEKGQIVDHLWERALVGDKVLVVDEEFDPIALLALYIKRSFALIKNFKPDRISGIMFTVPELTKRAIEVLEKVVNTLGFENISVAFEGREESIFYYVIHQPHELWIQDVLIYDFSGDELEGFRFHINRNAVPCVAFVDREKSKIYREDSDKDDRFLEIVKKDTEKGVVSLGYLIGYGFEGNWCTLSMRELCRNRRAFKGNNLYSKGACYAMRARMTEPDLRGSLVFLGKDKLKVNVGMTLKRANEEAYYAILDGGENWYDAKKEFDIILESGNSFEVTLTPLDGKNVRNVEVVLDGITQRERGTTRVHLKFFMESDDTLRICATDMGFGEIYPSTYQLFTKQIKL